jgi:hypothetical protein
MNNSYALACALVFHTPRICGILELVIIFLCQTALECLLPDVPDNVVVEM